MKSRNLLFSLVLFGAFAVSGAVLLSSQFQGDQPFSNDEGPLFTSSLPNFDVRSKKTKTARKVPEFQLPSVMKGYRGLSNYDLEGRSVVLNVYASWCPGCLKEHPVLMKIAKQGIVPLYGLNWREKKGRGAPWLKKHQNPYKRTGADPTGKVGRQFGVTGLPETLLISADGQIIKHHIGPLTMDIWRRDFAPLLMRVAMRKGINVAGR